MIRTFIRGILSLIACITAVMAAAPAFFPDIPMRETWPFSLIFVSVSIVAIILSRGLSGGCTPTRNAKGGSARLPSFRIAMPVTEIVIDDAVSVNGIFPYCIRGQWLDPKTAQRHDIESDYLWADPEPYIANRQVQVTVVPYADGNLHFEVDLSFLPKKFEELARC